MQIKHDFQQTKCGLTEWWATKKETLIHWWAETDVFQQTFFVRKNPLFSVFNCFSAQVLNRERAQLSRPSSADFTFEHKGPFLGLKVFSLTLFQVSLVLDTTVIYGGQETAQHLRKQQQHSATRYSKTNRIFGLIFCLGGRQRCSI